MKIVVSSCGYLEKMGADFHISANNYGYHNSSMISVAQMEQGELRNAL